MAKIDPHGHEGTYRRWKAKGMPFVGLTEANAALVREYLEDMEIGANVNPGSKRGARGYGRLRNLKSKLHTLALALQAELGITSWDDLESQERRLLEFTKHMREGSVQSRRGPAPLQAIGTYVKVLKAFWHWYQRRQRCAGKDLKDITIDLDGRDPKPKFHYFTIESLKQMCDLAAKHDYKVLMMFLFDSGIRAPTELMNVRVSDLEWNSKNNIYTLSIREETSKTFGRKIKLMLCSDLLRAYIIFKELGPNDYIFTTVPQRLNQYLRYLGHKVLGIGTQIGDNPHCIKDGLTLYDFRHASACYWLPRYKSESALKYRFGWKKSDMIHYYTEFLGMKDTIQEEDLYVDVTKTELERGIAEKGKEIELLQDQLKSQDEKLKEIMMVIKALHLETTLKSNTSSENPIYVP